MKAAGITLSTVGRRRRRQPVPGAAGEGGRRPVLRGREPGLDPGHLPQGDPAGLRPADRGGDVLPDPHLHARRSCAASRAGCRRCWATTGRRPSRRPRPCSSRTATTRSSPSGSTGSGARWPGRRTRPGAGRRAGSAGRGSRKFFSQMVGWTFPGEESGGIEAAFVDRGGADVPARGERQHRRLAARLLRDARGARRARPRRRRRSISPRWRRACTSRRSPRSRAAPMRCA